MKVIKYPFWLFYRIWFYALVAGIIILMFPFLFISVLKPKWYPYFFKLSRIWAKCILIGMGCYWRIERSGNVGQRTKLCVCRESHLNDRYHVNARCH